MVVHRFPDSEEITIIPVSDVHLGAAEHFADEWQAFCNKIAKSPNTYLILLGDLINNSIRTSVANPFDEVMRPREQKRVIVEQLMPIKDRIICSVSGNHERRSMKDSDTDISYDIMAKLDLEHLYRENIAFVKLALGERASERKPNVTFMFGCTHGSGGGIYTGASVNRNERFGHVIEGLDCLVVGHTHKGTVSRPSKIVVDNIAEKVTMRPFTVVTAESWLAYGGYAAQKMLLPSESGNPQRIILGGRYDNKKLEVIW
jgi:predicted phosphodiesterase